MWCSWYLDEVACYIPSCDVEASGQVRQGEALVHRTDVSDAVTGVDHHSSQQALNKTMQSVNQLVLMVCVCANS